MSAGRISRRRGSSNDSAGSCFVKRDVIRVEDRAERLVERNTSVAVSGERVHLGILCRCQIALLLNHVERRGSAQCELLLLGVEQLLFENAIVNSGIVTDASLAQ